MSRSSAKADYRRVMLALTKQQRATRFGKAKLNARPPSSKDNQNKKLAQPSRSAGRKAFP